MNITERSKSDSYHTGRLYAKFDAYFVSKRPECYGAVIYMGSSCQFKTRKRYKNWLNELYPHLDINVVKSGVQ